METLVCGDLPHAGNILLNRANHMIMCIQWNCEIKHCDHTQANGNIRTGESAVCLLYMPQSLPQYCLGRLRLYGNQAISFNPALHVLSVVQLTIAAA